MVYLHHLVPPQFNTFSKFNDLTLFLCGYLVELPLVWDWVVLVLEHVPVEVFGDAIMLRVIFLLGDFGMPTNNVDVHDGSINEVVPNPLGLPWLAHKK
eukprot:11950014-Ditylum_brightwellii.AAC.1